MKIHIVPSAIHERIMALGIEVYKDVFNVDTLQETLPINDMVKLHLARESFPYDFEANLNIQIGDSPLTMFEQLSIKEGLSEPHPMVDRLKWAIAMEKNEQGDVSDLISKYTLVPVEGDQWVVVQQSVHCGLDHPKEALNRENGPFFDQLIASLYYGLDFKDIAKTKLLSSYLESLRYHRDN